MTSIDWTRFACVLACAAAFGACDGVGTDVGNPGTGDDVGFTEDTGGGGGAGDTGGGIDASTDAGAVEDAGGNEDTGGQTDAGAEDTGVADVAEDTPDAMSDTGVDATDAGDASDASDASDADLDAADAVDAADVVEVRSPWEPGETPADYPFGYDSIIDQIILLEDGERGRDFTGDDEPDNALGGLVDALSGVVDELNVNGALAEAIDSGELNLGFGWPSFETESGRLPGPAEANFFTLVDPDDDPFTRTEWLVPADNFIDGTGEPRIRFVGEVDEDAVALLSSPRFVLRLEFFGVEVDVELLDAQLLGEVIPSDDGVVMDGVITGAAPVDAMWAAFNGVIAECDCVTGGDLIVGSGPTATCGELDTSACGALDAPLCTALPDLCLVLQTVISTSLDVDTDLDGEEDAFSTTLAFEANAATFSLAAE